MSDFDVKMNALIAKLAALAPRAENLAKLALSDLNGFLPKNQQSADVEKVKARLLQFVREVLE